MRVIGRRTTDMVLYNNLKAIKLRYIHYRFNWKIIFLERRHRFDSYHQLQ